MKRVDAEQLMESMVPEGNLRNHCYACEAVMRSLADRCGGDADRWGLVGLLHDLDYVETEHDPDSHGLKTAAILDEAGVDAGIIESIKSHNDKASRETDMSKAICCTDPATGFIVACALVRPDKSLETLKLKSARKRWKDKRFAAGASRDGMAICGELGLETDEFLTIAIDAMKGIRERIGL